MEMFFEMVGIVALVAMFVGIIASCVQAWEVSEKMEKLTTRVTILESAGEEKEVIG